MSGNIATNESTASGLAPVILNTPDSTYPNGQSLSALATGLVKVTTGTGALSTAVAADLPAAGIGAGAHGAIIKSITTDAQGRVTAETDATFADGSIVLTGADLSACIDIEQTYRALASKALGVAASSLLCYWHPFQLIGEQGWVFSAGGSGTRSYQQGWYRLDNTAAINSTAQLDPSLTSITGTRLACFLAGAANKWYMAARMRFPVAIGAATKGGMGMASSAAVQLRMGVDGSASTVNYVMTAVAGATIDSAVAIDANAHLFQGWRDGTNTFLQVDANTKVSGTARPNVDAAIQMSITDTAATSRPCDIAWIFLAVPSS